MQIRHFSNKTADLIEKVCCNASLHEKLEQQSYIKISCLSDSAQMLFGCLLSSKVSAGNDARVLQSVFSI